MWEGLFISSLIRVLLDSRFDSGDDMDGEEVCDESVPIILQNERLIHPVVSLGKDPGYCSAVTDHRNVCVFAVLSLIGGNDQ